MLTVGADGNADRSQHGGLQQGEAEGKAKALEAKSNARKIPRKVFLGFEEMHPAPSKSRRDSSKDRNWSWKCQLSSKICSILLILFASLYASSYTYDVLYVYVHPTYLLVWFDIWLRGVDMAVYGADNL